jgi:hypothetical protein
LLVLSWKSTIIGMLVPKFDNVRLSKQFCYLCFTISHGPLNNYFSRNCLIPLGKNVSISEMVRQCCYLLTDRLIGLRFQLLSKVPHICKYMSPVTILILTI